MNSCLSDAIDILSAADFFDLSPSNHLQVVSDPFYCVDVEQE